MAAVVPVPASEVASASDIQEAHQPSGSGGSDQDGESAAFRRQAKLKHDQLKLKHVQCHWWKDFGHCSADCHLPDPRGASKCYNCHETGHTASACPNETVL